MSQLRTIYSAFTGGEIAPELLGHVDLTRYRNSLAKSRNAICLPHGPVQNRPGFQFVREVKTSATATRLITFSYNNQQTFAIEMGVGYFRFHTLGGTLLAGTPAAYNGATAYVLGDLALSGGTNYYCIAATTGNAPPNATYWYAMPADGVYEIPNTFTAAELFEVHYTQSADVLTLVHPNHKPAELRRYAATTWTFVDIAFAPSVNPPAAAPTVVATYPTPGTPVNHRYAVSSIGVDGVESLVSSVSVAVSNDLTVAGNYNTITWSAPTSGDTPIQYEVYKYVNGLFGLVAKTSASVLTVVDRNITPDLGSPQQLVDTVFRDSDGGTAGGNYPSAVGYYEQRRVFAGTKNSPQGVWMTRPGTESDTSFTIPSRDDNALRFRVKALKAGTIRHVMPSQALVLLTADTEFRATSSSGGAVTPSSLTVKPQAYMGASNVQPVMANNNILYAAEIGGRLREMAYSTQSTAFPQYNSYDLSVLAPHLFDGYTIKDLAYVRAPYPICWTVSSSGKLLGMTYMPEQQMLAWHQHDSTNGVFESICAVTETVGDVIYAVVRRTINGATKRYVERMHTREFTTDADAYFVDCGSTYSGAPTTTVTGLTWLEGQTVSALADGRVEEGLVVTGGTITLSAAASKVQVGLHITTQIQTVPPALEITALGMGRVKNINTVWLRVVRTGTFFAGSAVTNNLVQLAPSVLDTYGGVTLLRTEEVKVVIPGNWNPDGGVMIQHTEPTPLTVLGITQEVSVGG